MPATPLDVENLSAGYGPTRVLENVSFSVAAGQRLAVLGRNGMGKTTLLATLAGQTNAMTGASVLAKPMLPAFPARCAPARGSDMCRRRAASFRR